jgi:hypothetical protein
MPNWFQQRMEEILRDSGLVFVDDIMVASAVADDWSNMDEHINSVEVMLKRLIAAGLTIDPIKSFWGYRTVQYLGHTLHNGTVSTQRGKVDAILKMPSPKNLKELESWLGMTVYYQRMIKDYARLAQPLNKLKRKGAIFEWGQEQQLAYEQLREALTTAPVLRLPVKGRNFILSTDWSVKGMSAVLSQVDE